MIQTTPNRQLTLGLPRQTRSVESRMETREESVRRVEYTSFPRLGSDTLARVGFTVIEASARTIERLRVEPEHTAATPELAE